MVYLDIKVENDDDLKLIFEQFKGKHTHDVWLSWTYGISGKRPSYSYSLILFVKIQTSQNRDTKNTIKLIFLANKIGFYGKNKI